MGTLIHATATAANLALGGYLAHAETAGRACLESTTVRPEQVGLLINTGVYRDDNLVEPSIAAFLQKKLGINTEYARSPKTPTFSFDLLNSACGTLNAIAVARTFLATSDSLEYVLLLSGDAHPSGTPHPDFPFTPTAAAMLLRHVPDQHRGFGRTVTSAVPDDPRPGLHGYTDLTRPDAAHHITITVDPDYEDRLLGQAASLIRQHLEEEQLDLSNVQILANQPTATFGARLADELALSAQAVALPELHVLAHSAGLTFAYHDAIRTGKATTGKPLLLLTVGAGPNAACAVYWP